MARYLSANGFVGANILVVIIGLTIGKHIGGVLLPLLWGVILYALLQIGKEKPIALSPLGWRLDSGNVRFAHHLAAIVAQARHGRFA
jgi:hypothetical protein